MIAGLHQPLHLGNSEQRDGNNIRIIFRGRQTKLYALWNSGFVNINEDHLLQYASLLAQGVSQSG